MAAGEAAVIHAPPMDKELKRRLAAIAVERGCGRFEWNVLDWNTPAIEFYRRIGAKPPQGWIPQQLTGEALIALANGAENA